MSPKPKLIMKRLILIQCDVAGTGKSTLTRCLAHYLSKHGVAHQMAQLADEKIPLSDMVHFDTETLISRMLPSFVDQSPLSIIEIESGLDEFFGHFSQGHDTENILAETDCQLSVLIPVGNEPGTDESVVRAAEVCSDSARHTIARTATSTYDVVSDVWDHSYAVRVMEMFEAVDLHLPEIGFQLEMELRAQHMDLASAMASPDADQTPSHPRSRVIAARPLKSNFLAAPLKATASERYG